jgi:hypothetical protein
VRPAVGLGVVDDQDSGGEGVVPEALGFLSPVGPYLPEQGGNVVLLTQFYWPTVHPAWQENRKEN